MPLGNIVIMHDEKVTRFNLCMGFSLDPLVAILWRGPKDIFLIRLLKQQDHFSCNHNQFYYVALIVEEIK